jgi:hypothetical protein
MLQLLLTGSETGAIQMKAAVSPNSTRGVLPLTERSQIAAADGKLEDPYVKAAEGSPMWFEAENRRI